MKSRKLTSKEREMRRKYTRIPGVEFCVDHQGFGIIYERALMILGKPVIELPPIDK